MKTDILTIGTEYLTGMVKEMDSFYLAGRLAELDAELKSLIIIGDDPDEVRNSLKTAFENAIWFWSQERADTEKIRLIIRFLQNFLRGRQDSVKRHIHI